MDFSSATRCICGLLLCLDGEGVSGAFLLLPFQISCLHFVTPSVSATNFVYNIVATPSGVYRCIREGRMAWHMAWLLVLATLPASCVLPKPRRTLWIQAPKNKNQAVLYDIDTRPCYSFALDSLLSLAASSVPKTTSALI
jgi:hypothetical protein